MALTKEHLAYEERIVWEIPIEELAYVRETIARAGTRQRPVPWDGAGRRVGYAILAPDAPNGGYSGVFPRRVFFLKSGDRYFDPDGAYEVGFPTEAVDPETIEAGKRGELPLLQ